MSTEKSDALVIRLADFSESSRVVTLFTRDFGKVSALAKGAKRLKSSFEAALDLLAVCRIVFLRKSTSGLDLLTEAQLVSRFRPQGRDLSALYSGYYVAELLAGLTEDYDPHPELFDEAVATLQRLSAEQDPRPSLLHFELRLLQEIGHLPNFDECSVCHQPIQFGESARFWFAQSGLICPRCGRPEYEHTEVQAGTIAVLRRLAESGNDHWRRIVLTPHQSRELRRILSGAMSQLLERRPKMLKYLTF